MARTLNLKALAESLDIDKGQLSRESKRPGFPRDEINGGMLFDADEVRTWRSVNVRRRKDTPKAQASAAAPSPADPAKPADPAEPDEPDDLPLATDDDEFIQILRSGKATALEISRATMQLASRRVARAATSGTIGLSELDDLKKSLQELRQAEADYIALEELNGQLIDRGVVREIVGTCATRLVQMLGVVENALAVEVCLWFTSEKFAALSTEERQRAIREFVAGICSEVRRQEADGVDAIIDEGLETRKDGDDVDRE